MNTYKSKHQRKIQANFITDEPYCGFDVLTFNAWNCITFVLKYTNHLTDQ